MITKIISGGQTGADQGGLEAGKELGLETGGTAPPRFMTEQGPTYYLQVFGLVEGEFDRFTYPKRTLKNVQDSDGTLWVGRINTPGYKSTYRSCAQTMKPTIVNPSREAFEDWLRVNFIGILNVAGNRESRNPGIQESTKQFLLEALG